MEEHDDTHIPEDEYDKPIPAGPDFEPFEDLPDREWIAGIISNIDYRKVKFNGKIQYKYKDVNGEKVPILKDGQPVENTEFNIEYTLPHYPINAEGKYRKAWASFGASLGPKSKFSTYLTLLGIKGVDDMDPKPTFRQIRDYLVGMPVFIQFMMAKNSQTGELKQKIDKMAVKRSDLPHKYTIMEAESDKPFPSSIPKTQTPGPAQAATQPADNPFNRFAPQVQKQPDPVEPEIAWDE